MKRILFLLGLLLAMINCAVAQKVTYGVEAGLNISSLQKTTLLVDGQALGAVYNLPSNPVVGFNAGVFADIAFDRVSIQPGLVYTTIGGENGLEYVPSYPPGGNNASYSHYTDRLNYLQLPVDVLYHAPVDFGEIFMGLGPYFGYGLSGSKKSTGYSVVNGAQMPTQTSTRADQFGGSYPEFKNPDYGANALIGVKLKSKISFSVGYNYGIANVSHSGGEYKYTNKTLQLSARYLFL